MAEKRRKNLYVMLRAKILWRIIKEGKLTWKKFWNTIHCFAAYILRRERTGKTPFMISFELWNECQAQCTFCRTLKGDIYDQNEEGPESPIAKGKLDANVYKEIIDQTKDHLLMAVLYINGEPLLRKDLEECLQYATDRKVATLISTNGQALTPKRSEQLLDSGLDFIKIAITGWTNDIYNIQHRVGDIERVKRNIREFCRINKEGGYGTIVMLDWILYNYNKHQLPEVTAFCDELGLLMSKRWGNNKFLEHIEPAQPVPQGPMKTCDWLWKVLAVNWDGAIMQCCEFSVWGEDLSYAHFKPGETDLVELWNGESARKNRRLHAGTPREDISMPCGECKRQGTAFKF